MKKRISVVMIIVILTISFCVPVSASENVPSGYLKTKEMFYQIMKDVGYIGTLPIRGFHQALNEFLNAKGLTGEAEQIQSDEDALNYINNGVSVQGDNNLVLTGNSLDFTKWFIDKEMTDSGMYYAYSFDARLYSSQFENGYAYREILQNGSRGSKLAVKLTGYSYLVGSVSENIAFVEGSRNSSANWIQVYLFSRDSWEAIDPDWSKYTFNDSTNKYELVEEHVRTPSLYLAIEPDIRSSNMDFGIFTGTNLMQFKVYRSLEDLRADNTGYAPYYVNTPVYDNFMNSNTSYTITEDNSNKITYGDVQNYVNSFNTTNGEYPTPSDINVYITNNIPNDLPSGGGGSGGSGSGGSGGSGSGDSEGIFDFLSKIGEVLGNLIKNLGSILAELIDGITEIISKIVGIIPNIFKPLFEYIFAGLPDELIAVIELGITVMVIVGLIRLFKG